MRVGLDERLAVHEHRLVLELDGVAGQADRPLDEIALRLLGKLEHDDVAAADLAHRQQRALDGASPPARR